MRNFAVACGLVLAAILQVGETAYPPLVLSWLEEGTGRSVNRGSLYVSLDRLERKGLLRSRPDAGGVREGRPRRYLEVTPAGVAALLLEAEPGFGLPEIYALLGGAAGHHVPRSDSEAALIQRVYRDIGPFGRAATEAAMRTIRGELGTDRPIQTYLDALVRLAARPGAPDQEP